MMLQMQSWNNLEKNSLLKQDKHSEQAGDSVERLSIQGWRWNILFYNDINP